LKGSYSKNAVSAAARRSGKFVPALAGSRRGDALRHKNQHEQISERTGFLTESSRRLACSFLRPKSWDVSEREVSACAVPDGMKAHKSLAAPPRQRSSNPSSNSFYPSVFLKDTCPLPVQTRPSGNSFSREREGGRRTRLPLKNQSSRVSRKPTEVGDAALRPNPDKTQVNTGHFPISTRPRRGDRCGDRLSQRDFLFIKVRFFGKIGLKVVQYAAPNFLRQFSR
jgi:hypothetical protein